MKTTMTVLGMSLLVASAAKAAVLTTLPVPVTHIYAPFGFDSNDNVEVIVTGYLPNLCYKAAHTKAYVQGGDVQLQVTALKNTEAQFCPQVVVPFLEVATLGVLERGHYNIGVNLNLPNEQRSAISIVESTSPAIDDFVYANVSSVERIEGTRRVILKGYNPTSCYELDQVKWVSNGQDTYSVLPILKQVSEVCPQRLVPFAYPVEVPTGLSESQLLLHVRVMNGKSVNALFLNE